MDNITKVLSIYILLIDHIIFLFIFYRNLKKKMIYQNVDLFLQFFLHLNYQKETVQIYSIQIVEK